MDSPESDVSQEESDMITRAKAKRNAESTAISSDNSLLNSSVDETGGNASGKKGRTSANANENTPKAKANARNRRSSVKYEHITSDNDNRDAKTPAAAGGVTPTGRRKGNARKYKHISADECMELELAQTPPSEPKKAEMPETKSTPTKMKPSIADDPSIIFKELHITSPPPPPQPSPVTPITLKNTPRTPKSPAVIANAKLCTARMLEFVKIMNKSYTEWNTAHLNGLRICQYIETLKLKIMELEEATDNDNDATVSNIRDLKLKLKKCCLKLKMYVDVFNDVVENQNKLLKQVRSWKHFDGIADVIFQYSWRIADYLQVLDIIIPAYGHEVKVKQEVMENIAHCSSRQELIRCVAAWEYQQHVNEYVILQLTCLNYESTFGNSTI